MKRYIYLIIFTFAAFILAFSFPVSNFMKGIYGTPGLLGLIGILYQIVRDQSKHEKMEYLQKQQLIFNIGSASHMANVAFDKHVEFCEEYLVKVHEAMRALWKNGATEEAGYFGNELYAIRLKHSAWLTEEIGRLLFPFEQGLIELGSNKGFINHARAVEEFHEKRSEVIQKVNENFNKILGIDVNQGLDAEIAIDSVIKKIREILGIEELVCLRKKLISEAIKGIEA